MEVGVDEGSGGRDPYEDKASPVETQGEEGNGAQNQRRPGGGDKGGARARVRGDVSWYRGKYGEGEGRGIGETVREETCSTIA